ncbi:hypothetical protein [Cellulomonas sp. KRMCY2]|uniref:hypothetical protein n=1 Tax=Cellulomonas sp. KRMCY2 TaxID=1304865 RepID=UPI00045EB445|nr:hypothetical protein [Cellulomonas sp. KRMCY2]
MLWLRASTVLEPDPLPYTLRTRDAPAAGISRVVLQGREFVTVRRGLRVPSAVDPEHPDVRIAAVAAQLPEHSVIGGWAAARLHERAAGRDTLEVFDGGRRWEEPMRGRRADGPARILICAPRESRLALRADVRVFRSPVRDDEVCFRSGVRVTSPLRTALDLARLLPLARALVAVDRMLRLGLIDADDLAAMVDQRAGCRGRPAAQRVVGLMDGGAESPQETLMRCAWIAAGQPRPACNLVVRDGSGRFVGRVDLIDQVHGVVGEYDGALHADAVRRSRDAQRQESLEELGLVVARATSADIDPNGRADRWQGRLRSAYRRAAGRAARDRRWVITAT